MSRVKDSMRVLWDDEDVIQGLFRDIANMKFKTEAEEKKAIQKISKVIVNEVKAEFEDMTTTIDHVHLVNDVKAHVHTKNGQVYAIIGGGRKTGYKWHMLDDGTKFPDGTDHTKATHFTSKALSNAKKKIDAILEEAERNITNEQ